MCLVVQDIEMQAQTLNQVVATLSLIQGNLFPLIGSRR